MRFSVWTSLLLACSLSFVQAKPPAQTFGVGFELALDYGVASVYFPNGTASDIAKIQGSRLYRDEMRLMAQDGMQKNPPYQVHDDPDQKFLSISSVCDHLPPWVCGRVTPLVRAHSDMLRALKTATESYLDAFVSNAIVYYSFPAKYSFTTLRSAASSLSLHLPAFGRFSGQLVASAHSNIDIYDACWDPDEKMPDDSTRLTLSIEYTRADLTVTLIREHCGLDNTKRVMHSTALGQKQRWRIDPPFRYRNGDFPQNNDYDAQLLSALRNITHLPLDDDKSVDKLKYISTIIIYGEAANDALFRKVVVEALKESMGNNTMLIGFPRNEGVRHKATLTGDFDPWFAVSRSAAWDCWQRVAALAWQEIEM